MHKSASKVHPKRKLYQHFTKIGSEQFEIKLIKKYPCADRTALDIEEERIKLLLNAQLNTRRAHRTAEQLIEYQNEANKLYREKNREKINERLFCKICGKTYTRANKAHHNRSKPHQYCAQFNQSKKITDKKYQIL
jgi:hypothetical protein